MKKLVFTGVFAFLVFAGLLLFPKEALAQSQNCYDIKGGQEGEIMGIPVCFCGSGIECLCITQKPCDEQK